MRRRRTRTSPNRCSEHKLWEVAESVIWQPDLCNSLDPGLRPSPKPKSYLLPVKCFWHWSPWVASLFFLSPSNPIIVRKACNKILSKYIQESNPILKMQSLLSRFSYLKLRTWQWFRGNCGLCEMAAAHRYSVLQAPSDTKWFRVVDLVAHQTAICDSIAAIPPIAPYSGESSLDLRYTPPFLKTST